MTRHGWRMVRRIEDDQRKMKDGPRRMKDGQSKMEDGQKDGDGDQGRRRVVRDG